ncbi:hypothetical protein KP509_12G052400, partial [Ceratopteris richardii]
QELEEAFRRFDADGDGKISPSELGAVFRSLGDQLTDEDLILMVKAVDKDGDGFVDLQGFISMNAEHASSSQESCGRQELEEAFRRFDADGDGKISPSELGAVFRSLGDQLTDEDLILMVKAVDKDGDGFVDLQGFISMNVEH